MRAAKRALRGIFEHQASVHAVLFYGDEGSGKSMAADALARFWLCREPTSEGACGACPACLSGAKGAATDRLAVFPRGASNWIHLAAVQEVARRSEDYEDVVPMDTHLRTPPLRARLKVVEVQEADRLYPDASNSLLKLLEEPPGHARFVLATAEASRVRPTIRSRCLVVPCELPTEEEWRDAYPNLEPWEEALARRSPGRLLRVRRQPGTYRALFDLAASLSEGDVPRALNFSDRFRKLVEALGKAEELNARRAGGLALDALAAGCRHFHAPSDAIGRIALAHRRLLGNVGAGHEFDALFAALARGQWAKPPVRSGVLA